jgi:hypothetical protein
LVSLPQKPGFPEYTRPGQFAARLGLAYDPAYVLGKLDRPMDFVVPTLTLEGNVDARRLESRRHLLKAIDDGVRTIESGLATSSYSRQQERAFTLLSAPQSKTAFDVTREPPGVRDKYGPTLNGMSMLMARRLVEAGVPFITINNGGWDTHKDNFPAMRKMLPIQDQAMSALFEDLAQRGLLPSTVVTWYGEFGRTPRVANEAPWFGGRHHWGAAFSAVVAGGGFQGGQVIGSTDGRGESVRDRPVYPWDLSASIYKLLGIDPHGRLPHPQGCVAYVSPIAGGTLQSGGLLTELM